MKKTIRNLLDRAVLKRNRGTLNDAAAMSSAFGVFASAASWNGIVRRQDFGREGQ